MKEEMQPRKLFAPVMIGLGIYLLCFAFHPGQTASGSRVVHNIDVSDKARETFDT